MLAQTVMTCMPEETDAKNPRDIEEARPACRLCRCTSTSTIVDVVRNSRNDARNVAVPPQSVAAAVFDAAVAAAPAVI